MDPNIRNFSRIEKFIKENPRQADARAFEWKRFLEINAPASPELYSIETAEDFYRWAQEHPEKNIDASVWVGKEISDSYYYLRDQDENEQMRTSGRIDTSSIPITLASLPILALTFLERPKIIQDDKNYQEIENGLKKEWIKNNPGKDFLSKEGIDYLYGRVTLDPLRTGAGEDLRAEQDWEEAWTKSAGSSLPKTPTLAQDAEKEFRNNPKFQKRVARYDKEAKKIYKKHGDDPGWLAQQRIAQEEINSRLALLEKNQDKKIKLSEEDVDLKKSQDEIVKNEIAQSVSKKSLEEFALRYPEKAKGYSEKNEKLKNKQKEDQSSTSALDSTRTFESVYQPQETILIHEPSPASASPSTKEPSSPQLPGGGINRGINAINSLTHRGFPNPFRNIGLKLALQAGRSLFTFLAANPWFWAVVAILIVVIFTFVIVMGSGGSISSEITPTPTIAPRETITPIPAVP